MDGEGFGRQESTVVCKSAHPFLYSNILRTLKNKVSLCTLVEVVVVVIKRPAYTEES